MSEEDKPLAEAMRSMSCFIGTSMRTIIGFESFWRALLIRIYGEALGELYSVAIHWQELFCGFLGIVLQRDALSLRTPLPDEQKRAD